MGRKDWEDVEWSRANAINYHARLLDGDKAEASVMELIRKLAGKRPPHHLGGGDRRGRHRHLLHRRQLCGAAGSLKCCCKAMSAPRTGSSMLDLLPALPKAWPTGKVSGLRARGGFEVDLAWQDGRLTQARIRRPAGSGRTLLRYGPSTLEVSLHPGDVKFWAPTRPSR